MQEIRSKSGAQITVPPKDSANKNVVLRGRPEAIAIAKNLIQEIIATTPSLVFEEEGTVLFRR